MNILEIIKKRFSCPFEGNILDEMLVEASKSQDRNIAVILTENELTKYDGENKEYVIALRENNRLKGMFDLGEILPNTNVNLILYVFTKDRPDSFVVGEYHGPMQKKRIKSDQPSDWKTLYSEYYYEYLHKIERWVRSGNIANSEFARFNTVNNELFEGVFAPKRYSENVYRVKAALETEKTVHLSEVADIIRPRPDVDCDKRAMKLTVSEWKYPIDYSKLREGIPTNTPLKKNDILFKNFDQIYLLDVEPEQEIHFSTNFYVIRPKGILPQYLLMYLQSDTAKIIMQSLSMGGVFSRIRMSDMRNIPIVMPTLSDMEYIQTFRLKYYMPKDIADYSRTSRLMAYMLKLQGHQVKTTEEKAIESVENILGEEWAQNIHVCKTEVMQEFLESDINELNVCFRGKAYKATLILAGSILEAVLIDWLTEIKGINYFDEPYIIQKEQWDRRNNCVRRDRNGNIMYYNKEAGLADYIDEIKELARPAWMKSHEAHEIRKKRNLVHAKLCMNDTTEINEQTCREVIQYLKEVIETRGIQQN